jgi:IS5 family transposase
VPDATTLLHFRHLLERHDLGAALFARIGELLLANGMKLSGGTIVVVKFEQSTSVDQVRSALAATMTGENVIQSYGTRPVTRSDPRAAAGAKEAPHSSRTRARS